MREMRVMHRPKALALLAVGLVYFSANSSPVRAQDWDSTCPRYGPQGGVLENEWQNGDGSWTGLYLTAIPTLHYYEVTPCVP